MAISLQFPNSKKSKEGNYTTHRENSEKNHYPNHSVGVKKHNCTRRENDRNGTNVGCNAFRPVTRRNVADMPSTQDCERGCDDISKCLDKVNDKTCPNIQPKMFPGIPYPAIANLGKECIIADYYDTPCIVNGEKQCKSPCSDRKIDREKFAFQDHVNRMQSAKQRCSVCCNDKHRVTYCDGSTDPMTAPCQLIHTQCRDPKRYSNEPLPCIMATATRSFGTCTACNTESTSSVDTSSTSCDCPPSLFMPSPYSAAPVSNKPVKKAIAVGGGCTPNACPLLLAGNKTGRSSIYTEALDNDMRSTPAQTTEEHVINVASSRAKENIQCPERCPFSCTVPCAKEPYREMLPSADKYCKDVPDTHAQFCKQLEEIRQKYKTIKEVEDYNMSLDNSDISDDKETSTEDVDNEEYRNILNNILSNGIHKSKQRSHKRNDRQSTSSKEFRKSGKKRRKQRNNSKEDCVKNNGGERQSNESSTSSTGNSINSVIDKIPTNSLNNEVAEEEKSLLESKSKEINQKQDSKVVYNTTSKNQMEKVHSELSKLLSDVVDNYVLNSNSNFDKTSGDKQAADKQGQEIRKFGEFASTTADINQTGEVRKDSDGHMSRTHHKSEKAQMATAITNYIDSVSQGSSARVNSLGLPIGYETSDINNMLKSFYKKVKEKCSASNNVDDSSNSSTWRKQSEEMQQYIQNLTESLLKITNHIFEDNRKQNEEDMKMARILEARTNNMLSKKTKDRIQAKYTGRKRYNLPDSMPTRQICAKRKGLKQTFRDPDERVSESLLKLNIDNSGYVEDHEYLQFSLRITEDIIRNDLYTNGQMKRVFKSHLEANRGRLDTQKMIDQINSLCTELNISFDEASPLENMTSIVNCCDKNDANVVCCCEAKKESGALEAKPNCLCNINYYKALTSESENNPQKDIDCECCQEHCTKIHCRGMGYTEPFTKDQFQNLMRNIKVAAVSDYDFANEGILQTVMYSETHCLGPHTKGGECNCVALDEMIRPSFSRTSGYIPSFSSGSNDMTRRSTIKSDSVSSAHRQSIGGKRNTGNFMSGLKIRGINKKDGELTPNHSNEDTPKDSAPVRIKTPVTALRTKLGGDTPNNNFVIVECPVLMPTENQVTGNIINANTERQTAAEVQVKVKTQVENSPTVGNTEIMEKFKEDMQQVAYANEINETLTDPLVVPPCNDCSCNADCNDVSGKLTQNATPINHEQSARSSGKYDDKLTDENLTQLTQNTNQSKLIHKLDDGVAVTDKDKTVNTPLAAKINLNKTFATAGLKSRLDELTAVTLAISNNNVQSMLEKHPTYRPMPSCTTCHFNENFIRPVESANIFYPSKALNTVYSKCLFQQHNLLLGDEYAMFNPYSIRPETINHFFPTACTQVASADLLKDSTTSVASDNSEVTGIVNSIMKASRDNSSNNSASQILKIPQESLIQAIKNELYKSTEAVLRSKAGDTAQAVLSCKSKSKVSSQSSEPSTASSAEKNNVHVLHEQIKVSTSSVKNNTASTSDNSSASKTASSGGSHQSTGSPKGKRESLLAAVKEEDYTMETTSISEEKESKSKENIEEDSQYEEVNEKPNDGCNEISVGDSDSYSSLNDVDTKTQPSEVTNSTKAKDDSQEGLNIESIAAEQDHESDTESSSDSSAGSVAYNNWMEKLDKVPSIKMTPSLKGSFDKAIFDTDKFRENYNTPDDGPIIAGMIKHIQNGQPSNTSNMSQETGLSSGSNNSKSSRL